MIGRFLLLGLAVVVLSLSPAGASGASTHYVPKAGDGFHYTEVIALSNGQGNYSGYTEDTFINGTIGVTGIQPNGTENASYSNSNFYENNQGQSTAWSSSGTFTFSATTYHYVQGTDNQTGDNGTEVWFFANNSLGAGATFYVLTTPVKVVSVNTSFALPAEGGKYVAAIYAEGNGTFQRNDVYGVFSASYTWQEYFDPSTGYLVGYVYTEQDNDGAGDGFTITDSLGVSSTTYALTPGAAPPPSPAPTSSTNDALVAAVVLVVVALIVVGIYLLVRSRRPSGLRPHSGSGPVGYAPPPAAYGMPPAPLNLSSSGQPPVQQIIVRETVKVPCRYCGTLIDSTATICPKCGAPRT
ncbi:MAG: zinc ribbon domain-containing protein [Thermoplasmata archaeon]|nr:zinc ribbon domain-containing protein [Thermoplasmata archaeon]